MLDEEERGAEARSRRLALEVEEDGAGGWKDDEEDDEEEDNDDETAKEEVWGAVWGVVRAVTGVSACAAFWEDDDVDVDVVVVDVVANVVTFAGARVLTAICCCCCCCCCVFFVSEDVESCCDGGYPCASLTEGEESCGVGDGVKIISS